MSFRPRCPKCNSSLWLVKAPSGYAMPEAGCDFCGTRIMGEPAITSLVETQHAEYRRQMKLTKQADKEREAREAALPPRKVARKVKPRLKTRSPAQAKARVVIDQTTKVKVVTAKSGPMLVRQGDSAPPPPTEAQRRRGSTTLTYCSVCGTHLYRRKKEIAQQSTFFCSQKHQKEWKEVQRLQNSHCA